MRQNTLTILSFGGGQDSTAILYKLIYDKKFRKKYAPNDLMVVMADTGNEHLETYFHVAEIEKLCLRHAIKFMFIAQGSKHFPKSWRDGLLSFYRAGNRVGSKCFPKTCTDNLKIKPIYNFVEEHVHKTYGTEKVGRKRAIREFANKYGKIDVLIGIARNEEKRVGKNEDSPHAWMRDCINKVYPLIDLGMNRQDCQDYIKSVGHEVPLPSNCILCPFMSEQELLYLSIVDPESFNDWVEIEANKIKANKHVENNMGVWGKKLLPEKLEEAKKKYGHMTLEDLREYKMSHGHCVKSKF